MSRPRSLAVGTLGQRLVRWFPKVTSSLNWPASTNRPQPLESDCAMMWPPSSPCVESALPLYGTCRNGTPVFADTSSMRRCGEVPVPVDPYDILPGFALAQSSRSWKDLNGESPFTTTPKV